MRILVLIAAFFAAMVAPTMAQDIPALESDPALHDLLPDSIKSSGKLRIATEAAYPPCEYFAEDGVTMLGFEPDLWNAIAQKMGVEVDVESIAFSGLLPGVQAGRYDVAIECISDNAERQEQVTFVNYSYYFGEAIYFLETTQGITEDPLSLCGRSTGGIIGSDFRVNVDKLDAKCVAEGKPTIEVFEYPAGANTLMALYAGRIDFAFSTPFAVTETMAANPQQVAVASVRNPVEQRKYMGMAVHKDQQQLAEALLAGLKAVQAEGVYAQIWEKWGISHARLDEPGINLATARPIPAVELQ